MKTGLIVLLALVAAVLLIKLLPLALVAGCFLTAGITAAAVAGFSVLAAFFAVVFVLAVLLSPIWVPVLAIIGLIALCRRSGRTSA